MATLQQVLEQVKLQIETHVPLNGSFKDVTLAEFPYCEDFPACHINFEGESDDPMVPGGGKSLRRITVGIYITLAKAQLEDHDGAINPLVEEVRNAIKADRTLGGVSNLQVTRLPVTKVPSPFGGPYVGTRKVTVEALITENL
jgi:hypothetical protein